MAAAMNEFWLAVHQLAETYQVAGLNADERMDRVLSHFDGMPEVARREVLADLALVAYNLSDIYVAAVSRKRQLESKAVGKSPKAGA